MGANRIQLIALEMNSRILKGCRGVEPYQIYDNAIHICRICIEKAVRKGWIYDPGPVRTEQISIRYAYRALRKIQIMSLD